MDQRLTQGRLSAWIMKLAHTLWNDRHPVVMVSVFVVFHVCTCMVSESRVLPHSLVSLVYCQKSTVSLGLDWFGDCRTREGFVDMIFAHICSEVEE
jgi:uncharacterized membrane protein